MRVLVFFHHDPGLYGILPAQPTQIVTGGYKRFIEIAKRLDKYDITLDVVETAPTYLKAHPNLHYACHEITTPAIRIAGTRLTDPRIVAYKMAHVGKKLAKNKQFDLILSPSESMEACLAAYLTSHESRVPVINWIQAPPFEKLSIKGNTSFSLRKHLVDAYATVCNAADKRLLGYIYNKAFNICVSKTLATNLSQECRTQAVTVCGNGVDINQINSDNSEQCLYDGIFVGRMVPEKGIWEAMEIFKRMCRENRAFKFAFIGGGDSRLISALQAEIRREKLAHNVFVLGYVDEQEKIKLIKNSKIFIYPTHKEGWGIALGEALAAQLPVVCYDLPLFKELFNCEAVRMCKEGNIEQMVAEAMQLIEDSVERERLGIIGRHFIQTYSWETITDIETKIYKHVADRFRTNG